MLFEILAMIKDTKDIEELQKSQRILKKTLSAIESRIEELKNEQLTFDLEVLAGRRII